MTVQSSNGFERLLSVILTVAAVGVAIAVVRREFFTGGQVIHVAANESGGGAVFYDGWRRLTAIGVRVGSPEAPVQIVEFGDVECPFCKRFHASFDSVKRQFRDSVALSYVHFPLPIHRFSRIGSRGVECASTQDRAGEFLKVVYDKQDSLGLKSWPSYAAEAGLADTLAFSKCVMGTVQFARIDSGESIARELEVTGTPTVLVNGWRFHAPPSATEMTRVVSLLLGGKQPFEP